MSSVPSGVTPGVADVGVTAADGSIRVAIVPTADSSVTEVELLEYCRVHLAPYEVPQSVTFVDQLPRNSVGKLLRQDLLRITDSDTPNRSA